MMLYEKDFLAWLRQDAVMAACFGSRIFFGIAPDKTENPFATLQDVSAGGAREIAVMTPRMQLDCFAASQFAATELAERVVSGIVFRSFASGGTWFQSVTAERRQAMRVEDGSWKVPVDIRFSCRSL